MSARKRIEIANRAEQAIQKFSDDTVLWLKDKTGQDADVWQQLAISEIEEHPNSLIVWPPRFGKTWSMEAVNIKELFCHARESLMIFAPKQEQANNALREHLDWIEGSEILKAYVAVRRGKTQLSDSKYELVNRSRAKTFGIYSHFDSEEASIVRAEEWDDMDEEIFNDRVIARGGRKNISGLPTRYRYSGTIQQGKGNMFRLENSGDVHVVTKFDIYDGLHMVQHNGVVGIYDENAIAQARAKYTNEQWLRIYLLQYTEAKNFIWESYLRECQKFSIKLEWDGVEYKPGNRYTSRGTVYCGFDCGHSGEGKQHSVYRVDFFEQFGEYLLWLNGFEWESTVDPDLLKKEFCDYWEFFDCRAGYGDALKANFISLLNDALYDRGLINIDRAKFPENSQAHWKQWALAPQWNTGKFKYLAGSETKKLVEDRKLIVPYFSEKDDRPIAQSCRRLTNCLTNVREVFNKSSYPTLEAINKEIGDDAFDSTNMATACANDRMLIKIDMNRVKVTGDAMVTSELQESILEDLQRTGNEADFRDF